MIWQLEGGENVVPLIAAQSAGEYRFGRVGDYASYERAAAKAKEILQSMLSSRNDDYIMIACDGFFTHNGERRESLLIEVYNLIGPDMVNCKCAIPYRSAQSEEGLAIYQPVVLTGLSDSTCMDLFLHNVYVGAQRHTKGFEFWSAHMDTSPYEVK